MPVERRPGDLGATARTAVESLAGLSSGHDITVEGSATADFDPELIVLAGFMRILGPEFVQHYQGRILNIHPSLLPAYTGVNTHQRVLDAGDKEHGVSVHFVTDELDGGPVVAQEKIAVLTTDTAAQLATRVAAKEHIIYPKVVSWFAAGRLHMDADGAYMDHDKLPAGGVEIHPAAVQDSIRLP